MALYGKSRVTTNLHTAMQISFGKFFLNNLSGNIFVLNWRNLLLYHLDSLNKYSNQSLDDVYREYRTSLNEDLTSFAHEKKWGLSFPQLKETPMI